MKKEDFRIRDPFVLTDPITKKYYLYGTTDMYPGGISTSAVFSVYTSDDLEIFQGPYPVFEGGQCNFWSPRDYWAAEVHFYKGKYYLFGNFKADGKCRATHILAADSPMGPFGPISEKPQTPEDWECLDGTLWVENGVPYLVFCHEWVQCLNGEICAVELTQDLTVAKGKPFLLFRATDNPCVTPLCNSNGVPCFVTDGPFLWREQGNLHMIWSSFSADGYAVLEAEAENLHGTWKHFPRRFSFDGGHAMIFSDLNGHRMMALHEPNEPSKERLKLIPIDSL